MEYVDQHDMVGEEEAKGLERDEKREEEAKALFKEPMRCK